MSLFSCAAFVLVHEKAKSANTAVKTEKIFFILEPLFIIAENLWDFTDDILTENIKSVKFFIILNSGL